MTLQPLYKVRRRKWQKDGYRKSPSPEKKDVVVEKRFFFFFHFSVRCCNTATAAAAEAELCRYTIPNPQKRKRPQRSKSGEGRENIAAARKYTEERAERGRKNERLRFPFLRFILHKKSPKRSSQKLALTSFFVRFRRKNR